MSDHAVSLKIYVGGLIMAIKSRVLYYSNNSKIKSLAVALQKKLGCNPNIVIPPDYPCDKERIVIICASLGKSIPEVLARFCRDMNKTRALNIALVINGPQETAEELKNVFRLQGVNVIDEVFYITGGSPISFIGKASAEEVKSAESWLDKILTQI